MSQNNFYTFQELKDFTNNFTDLTLVNISKFIETKTSKKYCVVKKELMTDITQQLRDNNKAVLDIKLFAMDIWEKISLQNYNTIIKWKAELEDFNYFAKYDVEKSTSES